MKTSQKVVYEYRQGFNQARIRVYNFTALRNIDVIKFNWTTKRFTKKDVYN